MQRGKKIYTRSKQNLKRDKSEPRNLSSLIYSKMDYRRMWGVTQGRQSKRNVGNCPKETNLIRIRVMGWHMHMGRERRHMICISYLCLTVPMSVCIFIYLPMYLCLSVAIFSYFSVSIPLFIFLFVFHSKIHFLNTRNRNLYVISFSPSTYVLRIGLKYSFSEKPNFLPCLLPHMISLN